MLFRSETSSTQPGASGSNQPSLPFLSVLMRLLLRRNSPRRRRCHEAASPKKLHAISKGAKDDAVRKSSNWVSRSKLVELLGSGKSHIGACQTDLHRLGFAYLSGPTHYGFETSQGYFCGNVNSELLAQAVPIRKNLGLRERKAVYASCDDQDGNCGSRRP